MKNQLRISVFIILCALIPFASGCGKNAGDANKAGYTDKTLSLNGNGYDIPATVCIPEGDGRFSAVVMLHGTGSDSDEAGDAYILASHILAEKYNIASIRIDFPGCGQSSADSTLYDFDSAVSDAAAAAGYILGLDNIKKSPCGIMGWSQGGTVALLSCARHPEIFGSVVTWAGAPDLKAVGLFSDEDYKTASMTGRFDMQFAFREPLSFSKKWCDDVNDTDVLKEFSDNFNGPVLAIAGTDDTTVDPLQSADEVSASNDKRSKTHLIDHMDHTFNVFTEEDLHSLHDAINATGSFFKDTL